MIQTDSFVTRGCDLQRPLRFHHRLLNIYESVHLITREGNCWWEIIRRNEADNIVGDWSSCSSDIDQPLAGLGPVRWGVVTHVPPYITIEIGCYLSPLHQFAKNLYLKGKIWHGSVQSLVAVYYNNFCDDLESLDGNSAFMRYSNFAP